MGGAVGAVSGLITAWRSGIKVLTRSGTRVARTSWRVCSLLARDCARERRREEERDGRAGVGDRHVNHPPSTFWSEHVGLYT